MLIGLFTAHYIECSGLHNSNQLSLTLTLLALFFCCVVISKKPVNSAVLQTYYKNSVAKFDTILYASVHVH